MSNMRVSASARSIRGCTVGEPVGEESGLKRGHSQSCPRIITDNWTWSTRTGGVFEPHGGRVSYSMGMKRT